MRKSRYWSCSAASRTAGGARGHRPHQLADGHRRDEVVGLQPIGDSVRALRFDGDDPPIAVEQAIDLRLHADLDPATREPLAPALPQHSGTEPRVMELIDQRGDHLTVGARAEQAFLTAATRSRFLIRCAAHSAPISLHGRPQTFSVYVSKKISNSRRPNRLTTHSSKVRSSSIGNARARR